MQRLTLALARFLSREHAAAYTTAEAAVTFAAAVDAYTAFLSTADADLESAR